MSMSEADRLYFDALASLKRAARPTLNVFSDNKDRIAAARADIQEAIEFHGIDMIIQAMISDIKEDVELRKRSGVEYRIAEKKAELLSKALYSSVRNADKPIEDADIIGELDE